MYSVFAELSGTLMAPRCSKQSFFDNVINLQVLLIEHNVSTHFVKADGAIKGLDLLETITRNTAQNPKEDRSFLNMTQKKPSAPQEQG